MRLSLLKNDIKKMLELTSKISELQTRLIYIGDLTDKKNYNEKTYDSTLNKISELTSELDLLKNQWID